MMYVRTVALVLFILCGCEHFCGDGSVDPGEVCDNGEENSDTTPGACRLNCSFHTVPTAAPDTLTTIEDTTLIISTSELLANDVDLGGETLFVVSVSDAVNGFVELTGEQVSFSPTPDFSGDASFTYRISNGAFTAESSALVVVTPGNDAPTALDDTAKAPSLDPLIIPASQLLSNDVDPDGDQLTITSIDSAVNCTAVLANGDVLFSTTPGFGGTATFAYTITDGASFDSALVSVEVNDAPEATANAFTTSEEKDIRVFTPSLLLNDQDINGDALSVISTGNVVGGLLLSTGINEFTFSPDEDFNGPGSFEYTISDGDLTDTAVVTITVTPLPECLNGVLDPGDFCYPVFSEGASGRGAVGDFNEDSRDDLCDGFSIDRGKPDGRLREDLIIDVDGGSSDSVAADFDGDGHLDVATINEDSALLHILRGKGDGTFDPLGFFSVGVEPLVITAADFDLDGKSDLAIAGGDSTTSTAQVLLGSGDGTFGSPLNISIDDQEENELVAVKAADFNADGIPDLAFAERHFLFVVLGNGDGTFSPSQAIGGVDITLFTHNIGMAAGDFNSDGLSDLAGLESGGIRVFFANPDGSFGSFSQSIFIGDSTQGLASGDLNGDGSFDLVVTTFSYPAFVALSNGAGGFFPPQGYTGVNSGGPPILLDTDGDDNLDIVQSLGTLRGNGDGTFEGRLFPSGKVADDLIQLDLNGDSVEDFLTGVTQDFGNDTVLLNALLGDGAGNFAPLNISAPDGVDTIITAGDMNADGALDIVAGTNSGGSGTLQVILGNGVGGFTLGQAQPSPNFANRGAVAELNGDGFLDLVVFRFASNDLFVYLSGAGGILQAPQVLTTPPNVSDLVIDDTNADGALDLLIACFNVQGVTIFPGVGDGTFGASQLLNTGVAIGQLFIRDFNNDAQLDLIAATTGTSLRLFAKQATGGFSSPTALSTIESVKDVEVADLDQDGLLDIVIATNFPENGFVVLRGTGIGTFAQAVLHRTVGNPISLAVSDLNGDTFPDLAITNLFRDGLSVFLASP